MNSKQIAVAGLVAGTYTVITIIPGISYISYGMFQVRLAEALTVLPYAYAGAVPGIFVGCLLANGYGAMMGLTSLPDVIFGSFISLAAAYLTFLMRDTKKPWLAPLPPIFLNAFGVPAYLHAYFGVPYWWFVISILIGQSIACFSLGYPLLTFILRKEKQI